jgi:hypothetical protein
LVTDLGELSFSLEKADHIHGFNLPAN